jgi:hypothetical protein
VRLEDRKKTAIITPFGLFQFRRMPFGLCNTGSSFQQMMDRVLAGLPFTYCYLDDLAIASLDLETHMQHLRQVFTRLQEFGLVINREKCIFTVDTFEFLSHQVSAQGAKPLSSYVEAVEKRPPPTTVKELQVFLGPVNFYRRFIPRAGPPSSSRRLMLFEAVSHLRRLLPGLRLWRPVSRPPNAPSLAPHGWVIPTRMRCWPFTWTLQQATWVLPCTSVLKATLFGSLLVFSRESWTWLS